MMAASLFAVWGIAEIADEFRLEVGDTACPDSAIQVLQPEIVPYAPSRNGVDDAGAVVPEDNGSSPKNEALFGRKAFSKSRNRGDWLEIKRHQCQCSP